MNRRVVIVQRVLPHYRVPLFEQLRELLAVGGIDLELIVGQPASWERSKNDQGLLDWATQVRNRYIKLGRHHLVWQPVWRRTRRADVVVVEQASRLLVNYALLAFRPFGGPRVGFWGHGRNLNDGSGSRIAERLKRLLIRSCDWWFAYTDSTAELLRAAGVDASRISVLQNAIDTRGLSDSSTAVTEEERRALRVELDLGEKAHVALVLGSIYEEKRPEFVVEAADLIRRSLGDFHLIVVGDGPLRPVFDTAARTRPWMHVVGMQTGAGLARYASLASLILNPGVVGLSALDSFALRLPMVTCDQRGHGPEFSYLRHGENGIVLPSGCVPADYATAVEHLLGDPFEVERLTKACIASSRIYTVEVMAANFAAGLRSATQHAQKFPEPAPASRS